MQTTNQNTATSTRLTKSNLWKSCFLQFAKWWPMLLGPAAIFVVYIAHTGRQEQYVSKGPNEYIALMLLAVPVINFLLQSAVFKRGFCLFMACLSAAFFCREWHFPGTSAGIYIALALLAFWAIKRKDDFELYIGRGKFRIWLIAVFTTYLLSQLISRRVFRYVNMPFEDHLHIYFEETVETTAHLMLLAASFAAWKLGLKSKAPKISE